MKGYSICYPFPFDSLYKFVAYKQNRNQKLKIKKKEVDEKLIYLIVIFTFLELLR